MDLAPVADLSFALVFLTQMVSTVKATISTSNEPLAGAAKAFVGADIQVLMPLGGLIDPATEKARIDKEIGKCKKEIEGLENTLAAFSKAIDLGVKTINAESDGELERIEALARAHGAVPYGFAGSFLLGPGFAVGSGTTVTRDVPRGSLAITRVKQVNVEGWAERFREAQGKRKKSTDDKKSGE